MTRPILEVPKAWNNYHLASASYEGALRGGNLDRARKWLNEAAEELESAIAQQAVAAEREKWAKKLAEVGRLGFITGYVRAEGERYYRDTGFTLFPAERDAFEARAEDTFRVLEELPPEVRPPLFAALATTEEG